MIAVIRVSFNLPGSLSFNPPPMWDDAKTNQLFNSNDKYSLAHFMNVNTLGMVRVGPFQLFPTIQLKFYDYPEYGEDPGTSNILEDMIIKVSEIHSPIWQNYSRIIILLNHYQSIKSLGVTSRMTPCPKYYFPLWQKLFKYSIFRIYMPASIVPIIDEGNNFKPHRVAYHEYLHSLGLDHLYDKNNKEIVDVKIADIMSGINSLSGNQGIRLPFIALSAAHMYVLCQAHQYNTVGIARLIREGKIVKLMKPTIDVGIPYRLYAADFVREFPFPDIGEIARACFLYVITTPNSPILYFVELRRAQLNTYDAGLPNHLSIQIYSYDTSRINRLIYLNRLELSNYYPTARSIVDTKWGFGIIVKYIEKNADQKRDASFVDIEICGLKYYKMHAPPPF